MDNWSDNEALRTPSLNQKPSYRRSFSELPISQNLHIPNINRRSLGSETSCTESLYQPKSSTSMTDIQSTQHSLEGRYATLHRSTGDISSNEGDTGATTLYTYIGISEPDKDKSAHIYENLNAHNKGKMDLEQHEEM